jgi:hypothetical protein
VSVCECNTGSVVLSGGEIATESAIVSACGSLCLCSKRECDSMLVGNRYIIHASRYACKCDLAIGTDLSV